MITMENDLLRVQVSPQGAELQSFYSKPQGRELLWQGDPAWWGRRSPLLFPIVGGMWNGRTRLHTQSGAVRELVIPKHGFMRDALWQVAGTSPTELRLCYEAPTEHLDCLPWPFRLEACFQLCAERLKVSLTVCNLSPEHTMYFQLGGHPGFQLPDFQDEPQQRDAVDGYLRLLPAPGAGQAAPTVLRAGTQGCVTPERFAVPTAQGEGGESLVPVCRETFLHEALIFDGHQILGAELLDRARRPLVRVESQAPVWLFWQPQGEHAPFLCAEPWYGLCDYQGFEGDISERPYIQTCPPAGHWSGGYDLLLPPGA